MMTYCDLNFDKILEVCSQAAQKKLTSNDLTIPVLSFMSGKKVSRFIHQFFGDHELEDIWLNSYCVSSNFSNSQLSVHERGLIRQKVMASIAIPGIFPPIVIDQDLHVDGGVVDNLPIEPMYRFPLRHIIAISLSSNENVNVNYPELPSGRRMIWNKLTRKKTGIPGLGALIVDSMTLNSRHRQETFKSKVSLYIELDLKDVGFLDDKKWKQTVQKGQDQAEEFLRKLPETDKFWLRAALAEAAESLKAH
jgi:predicted acylesterase/phospholipase RssA